MRIHRHPERLESLHVKLADFAGALSRLGVGLREMLDQGGNSRSLGRTDVRPGAIGIVTLPLLTPSYRFH